MDLKTHYLTCECYSEEHTLRYTFDEENDEIYTSVFLGDYPTFLGRIKNVVKYIFGYACAYGHFDCTTMGLEESKKLRDLLNEFIKGR
jgi:hypothetical protein